MKKDFFYPFFLIFFVFVAYYFCVYFWLSNNQFVKTSIFYDFVYFLNLIIFLLPLSFFVFKSILFILKIYISCDPYNIKNIYQFFWCLEVLNFEDKYKLKTYYTDDVINESKLLINHIKKNKKDKKNDDFYILKV